MSNELNVSYTGSNDVYALVRSAGTVWAPGSGAFATWANADIDDYDLPLASLGGDFYGADFPTAIDDGTYRVFYYAQAGSAPAITDLLLHAEDYTWASTTAAAEAEGLEDVDKVRRMCALAEGDTTYTDAVIEDYLVEYELVDADGYDSDNSQWTATYDLHAAAARIWQEKAAAVADEFNFAADGATYGLSEKYGHYMKQSRYHASRRSPTSIIHRTEPEITSPTELAT